jgi:hypothetical protein
MKLSKDELIKKLAEAIVDVQTIVNPEDADRCTFCYKEHSINYNKYPHESDCIVLLAEEVLKEDIQCSKCNGTEVKINTECMKDKFNKFAQSQENIPQEFVDIVNKEFWNLV